MTVITTTAKLLLPLPPRPHQRLQQLQATTVITRGNTTSATSVGYLAADYPPYWLAWTQHKQTSRNIPSYHDKITQN
ncbi:hypothetical protein M404DRAFT_326471 [Pisolithus tinctorius Marx 270]|uniref:Uncharacterized protein n=1 Tax=Pisolithus tinctorius Marx 270 TaxID=870435 RepID=A0A0C3JI83_PISTI|nr:hypothetical protein M404DRAFT_326471 [Pisolithus tinctorius Marx 270]